MLSFILETGESRCKYSEEILLYYLNEKVLNSELNWFAVICNHSIFFLKMTYILQYLRLGLNINITNLHGTKTLLKICLLDQS